jgi:hypothetical protein
MRTIGLVLLFALAGLQCDGPSDLPSAETPLSPPTTTARVAYKPLQAPIRANQRDTQPSPTTTTTLPPGKCAEWYPLAMEVGWPEAEWPTLDRVLWRESRCRPEALNGTDPNGGSSGLLQINYYWCKPSQWSDAGWLQDQNVVESCHDLFDARKNLLAGLAIYRYGVDKHGYGWGPWSI